MHIGDGAAQEAALHRKARGQVLDRQQRFLCALDGFDLFLRSPEQLHRFGIGFAAHLAQLGDGGQQRLGIGVLGVFEDFLDRAFFDLVAAEHDDDAIGHLGDNGHVMGDEHDGGAGLAFQAVDQREDFGLNGHIQRGGGFIRDQQPRRTGQRHGDHHTLAHPARQLVRVLCKTAGRFGDADLGQKLQRAGLCLRLGHVLVQAQPFGQLATDGKDRVQRGHRFLKDHPDLIAANITHHILICARQIDSGIVLTLK